MTNSHHFYSEELEGTWEEILTYAAELAGRRVRLIVLPDEKSSLSPSSNSALTLSERRAFLQLPLEERRRILTECSEAMVDHYEQDAEWRQFLAGDIIEY